MSTHRIRVLILLCLLPAAVVLLPKPKEEASLKFLRIHIGMERGEVEQELGRPAGDTEIARKEYFGNFAGWSEWVKGKRAPVWIYSDGLIVIRFDDQGRVIGKHLERFSTIRT